MHRSHLVKHRLVHLDCLRALAALSVCVEHLRAFLFVQYGELKTPNLPERIFYFVTSLGHQAVMIFFVLSGFLIGGSVVSARKTGRWSWFGYCLRRITRLWMVLIPALLLTLLWDWLGKHQSAAGYHGEFRSIYNSGPALNEPADLRASTFLGNSFFLQTIFVNCYGTNGPLWSLANEFWYYLLFPIVLSVLTCGRLMDRLLCLLLATPVFLLLPKEILKDGLVWLFGTAVFAGIQNEHMRRWVAHPCWMLGSGVLALTFLVASQAGKLGDFNDLVLGAGFACLIAGLAVRPGGRTGIYSRISVGASDLSYTLYLVHFPLLTFLFFSITKGHQMVPGNISTLWFATILTGVLVYAAVIWWCFERNTDRVRKGIERILHRPKSEIASSAA